MPIPLNPTTVMDFSEVTTPQEALAVWEHHQRELSDSQFVLATPSGQISAPFANQRFGDNGLLRSVFGEEKFFVLNARYFEDFKCGHTSPITIDHDILFDANAASYLRRLFEGSKAESLDGLRDFLKLFKGNEFNRNPVFYTMENASAFACGKRFPDIYDTLFAWEQLEDLDCAAFLKDGSLRFTSPREEQHRRAKLAIVGQRKILRKGMLRLINFRHDSIYAVTLKICALQLRDPSPSRAKVKLRALVTYMMEEVGAYFKVLSVIAWDLFMMTSSRLQLFNKIQARGVGTLPREDKLLETVRNLTWDLLHIQSLQDPVGFGGRNGSFMVPYFLTFDGGAAQILDSISMQSCLNDSTPGGLVFFPKVPKEKLPTFIFADDNEFLEKYFSIEAHSRRQASRDHHAGKIREVVEKAEREVIEADVPKSTM